MLGYIQTSQVKRGKQRKNMKVVCDSIEIAASIYKSMAGHPPNVHICAWETDYAKDQPLTRERREYKSYSAVLSFKAGEDCFVEYERVTVKGIGAHHSMSFPQREVAIAEADSIMENFRRIAAPMRCIFLGSRIVDQSTPGSIVEPHKVSGGEPIDHEPREESSVSTGE
jgi:hypothetical protein